MKRIRRFFRRYINGTKGVISLFLAILMVPFVTIAGSLINAGRINSAVAIFDEALCNASNSTLGTYDAFLRSRFALMAMSQDTSSGGTQFGSTSPSYSADDFVNDLFTYYMEQNVGTLSNTYSATNINATGLYPLSDTSVLLSSVLQAGKITVPAKLAIDWGSLDDMLKSFTKALNLFSSFEDLASSGMNVASDVDKLIDKQESLEKNIDDCNTAKSNYDTTYNTFISAINDYNNLIDNINTTSAQVSNYQQQVDQLSQAVAQIEQQIQEKQDAIAELEEDKDVDHSEEIEELNEEIEELEKELEKQSPGYTTAKNNLNSAKSRLDQYRGQLSAKRQAIESAKSAYYDAIVALRDQIDKTCDAAVAFQSAAKTLVNDGEGLISNVVTTGIDVARSGNQKMQDDLRQESQESSLEASLAGMDGYPENQTYYNTISMEDDTAIIHLQEDYTALENKETIVKAAIDTAKSVNSGLTDFANRDIEAEYRTIYNALDALRLRVNQAQVPTSETKMPTSDLYYSFNNPIEKAQVSEIIKNIEEQIENNSTWVVLKTLISFVKALLNISVYYDPELTSSVTGSGLPSSINRDDYPLTNPYEQEDSAQSEYYKSLLNSYAAEDIYMSGGDMESPFEKIMSDLEQMLGLMKPVKLRNLKKIGSLAKDIFYQIGHCQLATLAKDMGAAMGKKMLLVGYVSYNTANRTTYTGKALTGASYGLPNASANDGLVFSGAETEYIFGGSLSEKDNQTKVFHAIWVERLVLNIFPVVKDNTIRTLASELGSVTFGIGFIIVYAAFFALESFIDCIILVNGGEIPMLKSYVYVTPPGIPKLLQALTTIKLKPADQKKIYEKATECANKMDDKLTYPPYSGNSQSMVTPDPKTKISSFFKWDYTKSLQILLLLGKSSDTMLNRLADIIQMEGSYNASKGAATYGFNLDKSYTYLRASGSFTSNLFIKIGEDSDVSSKTRVIYNGY